MIIELPNTRTREISRKIDELHEERGESATGRVLTLLISTTEDELEHALEVANSASREHPCRVIAIVPQSGSKNAGAKAGTPAAPVESEADKAAEDKTGLTAAQLAAVDPNGGMAADLASEPAASNLDAEVRFGADAGAGEIIVLRPHGGLVHHPDTLVIPLLVPDAPVVAWWPTEAPANPSKDLLGAMARSRITDAMRSSNPLRTIEDLRRNRSPKNIDMSWTRLTVWRAMLATMLDQPPHLPIIAAKVTGPKDFLPMDMLAAWLRLKLGVSVAIEDDPNADAVTGVYLTRADGVLSLERPSTQQAIAVISTPGQTPQSISVPARTLEECLSEELRRLDPDEVYAEVLSRGWDLIHPQG
ncbi:glucose-6-phosphate dehydrogenase assembly protein OpcA [Bifidobacterium leontopitheci]|uniref:OpcA protein n=1 Tax=Bifidobacterium leontopitheci TaxID=2650774 RepID=A0A6I1GMA7_9BIFI|nr:glucose-6-phosphate dehydrogenase assembly protein OpcA [Bifidobacterium leontopitheci]KAB7790529.1 OpcA protein [Bifidobacterium leontopitheci]